MEVALWKHDKLLTRCLWAPSYWLQSGMAKCHFRLSLKLSLQSGMAKCHFRLSLKLSLKLVCH
jgi:hypothetical protein